MSEKFPRESALAVARDLLRRGEDAPKGGTWGCNDIERLLNAIKKRQKDRIEQILKGEK